VPLSEEELRLLEQMERALVAEDPKLASTLRGTTLRATARRRAVLAGGVFVLGIAVLMTGAVMQLIWLAVVGFVVMLGSAYVALSAWRGQNQAPERPTEQPGGAHPTFSVIDGGGRGRKRSSRGPKQPQSHQSMMEKFEERWRRRRDQNGY
jgi:hypothetical protein